MHLQVCPHGTMMLGHFISTVMLLTCACCMPCMYSPMHSFSLENVDNVTSVAQPYVFRKHHNLRNAKATMQSARSGRKGRAGCTTVTVCSTCCLGSCVALASGNAGLHIGWQGWHRLADLQAKVAAKAELCASVVNSQAPAGPESGL